MIISQDNYCVTFQNVYLQCINGESYIYLEKEDFYRFHWLEKTFRGINALPVSKSFPASSKRLVGNNLMVRKMKGNIGHFFNIHFYSFFVCYMRQKMFNIYPLNRIVFPPYEPNHYYLAKKCINEEDNDKILVLEDNDLYFCENLIVTKEDMRFGYRENDMTLCPLIRKKLWVNMRKDINERKKILIYNRTIRGTRGIVNINDVVSGLKSGYDVKLIETDWFTNNSAEDCWKAHYEADIYISIWGANITHCLICNPSCKIILLRPNLYNTNKRIGNAWFWEEPTHEKWSIEYLYTKELSSSFHILDCDFEKSDVIPCAHSNIIVDSNCLLNLIKGW